MPEPAAKPTWTRARPQRPTSEAAGRRHHLDVSPARQFLVDPARKQRRLDALDRDAQLAVVGRRSRSNRSGAAPRRR